MLEMNPEIRAQWCAALRSGDYQQTKRALRHNDSYCCLGVLCDLAVKAGIIEDAKPMPMGIASDAPGRMGYDGTSHYLPERVQTWAALASNDPEVGADLSLAIANDWGQTFAEIADLIDGGAQC